MDFFLIILLFVFAFLIARAVDQKNKSHNKQGYTSNHSYDVYNKTDKTIPVSDERKKNGVISVVGGFYRSWEAKKCIRNLYACETVFLREEPDNPYDPNAIMVLSKRGLHIGYISKYNIQTVKDRMLEGPVKGSVFETMDSRYE